MNCIFYNMIKYFVVHTAIPSNTCDCNFKQKFSIFYFTFLNSNSRTVGTVKYPIIIKIETDKQQIYKIIELKLR